MSARVMAGEEEIKIRGQATWPTTLVDLALNAEYDLHYGTTKGQVGLAFLRLIEQLAVQLNAVLPDGLRPSLRKEMLDLFLAFDATQAKYLNKVGELAATNFLLSATGGTLVQFEAKIPGLDTSVDVLVRLPSGKLFPVEYLNVHMNDSRVTSPDRLNKLLEAKVREKLRRKLKGSQMAGTRAPFFLQLILWFKKVETVHQYAQALVDRASRSTVELPICILGQRGDGRGYVEWQFASVARLFPARA